jgi:hypothetical protein
MIQLDGWLRPHKTSSQEIDNLLAIGRPRINSVSELDRIRADLSTSPSLTGHVGLV